jgi:hypothetical protein
MEALRFRRQPQAFPWKARRPQAPLPEEPQQMELASRPQLKWERIVAEAERPAPALSATQPRAALPKKLEHSVLLEMIPKCAAGRLEPKLRRRPDGAAAEVRG